jgi:hypothetical protein
MWKKDLGRLEREIAELRACFRGQSAVISSDQSNSLASMA